MENKGKILILNLGGTFNKVYNPISGELDVPKNNSALEDIFKKAKISHIKIKGLIYKDSLDIDEDDRLELLRYIQNSSFDKILIIHGTDTMDKSADTLFKALKEKTVVLTGAMIPYSIDPVEAASNLMLCYGFLQNSEKKGVFIGMHGFVKEHDKIKKNKQKGVFECLW